METSKKYYIVRTIGAYSKKENDRKFDELTDARKCFDALATDVFKQAAIVEVVEKAMVIKCN